MPIGERGESACRSGPPVGRNHLTRRALPLTIATSVVLVLSACGSDDSDGAARAFPGEECVGYGCSDEQDAELLEGEAEANDVEVPGSEGPYEWPDGVQARVVSVVSEPVDVGPSSQTHPEVTFTGVEELPS